MKLALAMIVKGVDEEAEVLKRCLMYASSHVDAIYITATYKPGETVSPLIYKVCEAYKAVVSTCEWIGDFAAARNYNFSQVPFEFDYILWLDADDAPRGLADLKPTIEAHPADVYTMFYLYAFDEHKNPIVVHQKTRVIKNDGCVSWYGMGIHEDFREHRSLTRYAIEGIDVLHFSTEERLADSRNRNYEIASGWLLKHSDDPRSYWNLANSAFGVGRYDQALTNFGTFMLMSKSDDEKYIARQRQADVYQAKGEIEKAMDEARYAIGLKPEYPDAYHLAGRLYYQTGQYEKAKDMFLNGLGRPSPVYNIIVYNPREYDYQPLMNLAKTYYALNLPQLALPALEAAVKIVPADAALKKTIRILRKESKEGDEILKLVQKMRKITDKDKLQKALDKIPEKFKFHPEVLRIRNSNFVKETSTGKDLVIFCGYTAEEWTPQTIAKKGSGGSEEAAVALAQGLADKGWNVTVYNNCGTEESVHGKVAYKPYMAWNYRDKQDVVILWRQTKPLDWEINAAKILVDMHDVIPAGEFTALRLERVSKVLFKSQYHRGLFKNIPDSKCAVIPNGIDPAQFSDTVERDPYLLINTASPVRALTALIDILKEVRKEVPQVKMKWAYGWVTTDKGMEGDSAYPDWKAKVIKGMAESGIEDVGRLNHKEIAKLYQEATLYVYPTGFPEIDCISVTKALAAGCHVIATDYGALAEKNFAPIHWPYTDDRFKWQDMAIDDEEVKKEFVKAIVDYLKNPKAEKPTVPLSWEAITNRWNEIL